MQSILQALDLIKPANIHNIDQHEYFLCFFNNARMLTVINFIKLLQHQHL